MQILDIDIGGTGVKGAPVDTTKGVLLAERLRLPTPKPSTPREVADVVAQITRHFTDIKTVRQERFEKNFGSFEDLRNLAVSGIRKLNGCLSVCRYHHMSMLSVLGRSERPRARGAGATTSIYCAALTPMLSFR